MKILAVIPARGGSKGIPRKNVRLMNGKPLISYAITLANALKGIYELEVAVSTDDDEIASIARNYGADVIGRPIELAQDATTLDPVVNHAVLVMEKRNNISYDIVITLQPTSPTLKAETLDQAIQQFMAEDYDAVISAKNHPKLAWGIENGSIVPKYERRVNRQQLPKYFEETGGFVISRRSVINEKSRLGKKINIHEINKDEAIDIDDENDWIVCENLLRRKKIVFRVDGEEILGMGHVYRCLTLAYKLIGNDICFVTKKEMKLGAERLVNSHYRVVQIEEEEQFFEFLREYKPDVIVNDILNTTKEYMERLKYYNVRIVNFEDVGSGAILADAVINALYENQEEQHNTYNGFNYFCIRDEFLLAKPKEFAEKVKNVLIMFGGSDPSNLTDRMYHICQKLHEEYKEVNFNFITGFGYRNKEQIKSIEERNIFVFHDVKQVSKFMGEADLAVTSQGRTIYELAYMGVPAIVLAQNKRETEHLFAQIRNGFINLGIGFEQDEKTIMQTLRWLIDTPMMRKEMRILLLSKEFNKGLERVKKIILGE